MRALEPLELELKVAVSRPAWEQGTQTAAITGRTQPQKLGLQL